MNLIDFDIKTKSDDKWFSIIDFRKHDYMKVMSILEDMFKRLSGLFDLKYEINLINNTENTNTYLSEYATYMNSLEIKIAYKDNGVDKVAVHKIDYPYLVKDNFFILNGSIYIPLFFLERSPIDRLNNEEIYTDEDGSMKTKIIGKILLNLLPSFNMTFDFASSKILYKGKKNIDINLFFSLMFKDDQDYIKYLLDKKIITTYIEEPEKTSFDNLIKALDMKSLNILKDDRQITLPEFFDDYLLLDYFKGMFKKIYGVDDIKSILKIIVGYYLDEVHIDMSDLKNRRVVINEYLINPLFEYYLRFLRHIQDKSVINSQNINENENNKSNNKFIPSINKNVLITSGFRTLMHAGTYVNISLPFMAPLIYKVSQKIYIVGEKVPKSWTANHPSSYGKICPISVSAQNMGENLVFTSDVRLDYYGLIEGTGAILEEREELKNATI